MTDEQQTPSSNDDPSPRRRFGFGGSERMQHLREDLTRTIQNLEPMQLMDLAGKALTRGGSSFFIKFLTVVVCAFFFSDLAALMLAKYIPEPPPARPMRGGAFKRPKSLEDYQAVMARNLFNSRGVIPGEEAPVTGGAPDLGGPPVRTTLPFNLIGTLILRDELRSIATIEDKSASMVYPVRIDDEIPAKARIIKIEPNKVIFLNTASGRREFVDLPEDLVTANPRITLGGPRVGGGPGIEAVSGTQFNISRSEVDRALADLNNILTQARAVPNFENGLPAGYKLFQIVPGSIYDKLGLKNGDVIAGLDGQPINDPGKAFEMLSRLKETPHLEIQVKRDGRPVTFAYDIR